MTAEMAIQYAPLRMEELGIKNYAVRFRHIIIEAGKTIEIAAFNQLYFLIGEPDGVTIYSASGLFDRAIEVTNGQQHEHQGQIFITNQAEITAELRFLQVIPRHKCIKKKTK